MPAGSIASRDFFGGIVSKSSNVDGVDKKRMETVKEDHTKGGEDRNDSKIAAVQVAKERPLEIEEKTVESKSPELHTKEVAASSKTEKSGVKNNESSQKCQCNIL